MANYSTDIFAKSESRAVAVRSGFKRAMAERKVRQSNSVGYTTGGSAGQSNFDATIANQNDNDRSIRQYEAIRNTVWTAIRPIWSKAAEQPFRCGIEGASDSIAKGSWGKEWLPMMASKERHAKMIDLSPMFLKDIGQNITPLENYPLLDLFAKPNEHLTGMGLKMLTMMSMVATGRAVWWFDSTGEPRSDVPSLGSMRLWYVPRNWVRRPPGGKVDEWIIQAPSSNKPAVVSSGDLFMPSIPDPGNPFASLSTMQSQARTIDTEEKILRAQSASMDNAIKPSMIMTVGRVPGMPGSANAKGTRPILTGPQRAQIIDAIKLVAQGVHRYGDPIIIDGLIEDVRPYMASPHELDLVNSTEIVKQRIMQAFGVSPVVAGFSESVNRAGSVVAMDNFYQNTLNPLIAILSEQMDSVLGPRFSAGGRRLRVWMEKAVADDAEAALERVRVLVNDMTLDERREFLATGRIKLNELTPENRQAIEASRVAIAQSRVVGGDGNQVAAAGETK